MKRIQYHHYGGPNLMRLEDFELGTPKKGEVAVNVKFAAINPIDWKLRSGQMKIVTGNVFPRAMGMDFSGTVISVGPGVVRFKPGDAVFGLARFKETGALAQAVITKETSLAKKPDNISFEDAACLGTPGVTAWNGLVDKAKLTSGKRGFINGCTGAVGEAAVQVARMPGATVWGSCSAGVLERARSLGVQTVFDYRTTDLSKLGEHFDVVYDTAATMTTGRGIEPAAQERGIPGPQSNTWQVHSFDFQPAAEGDCLYAHSGHPRSPCPCRSGGKASASGRRDRTSERCDPADQRTRSRPQARWERARSYGLKLRSSATRL